jgi:hypothetical protein
MALPCKAQQRGQMAVNASWPYGGGAPWASGEWDDIYSPLAAVTAWFDQAPPPCAGAPAVAVANHAKSSKFDYEDLGAGGWATARAGDDAAESGSEGECGDTFADVWCAAAMPLPISPPPVPFSSAARQGQQATLKICEEDTDASQAPSRVASPALGACRERVVPAVIIASSPDGDTKEGRGAPARARAARVSAFDLEAVDEKTRRRLIKNRASAERSRMQRKAKMQELELRCEQQEQEIQRLRAQLEGVSKHLSREPPPPLA